VPTVVQQRNVPDAIRSLSTLESPDYVHVFTVASAVTDKSPEQWARATVEGLSPWGRLVAWRVLCGLRLESRPSPEHLAGDHYHRVCPCGHRWVERVASNTARGQEGPRGARSRARAACRSNARTGTVTARRGPTLPQSAGLASGRTVRPPTRRAPRSPLDPRKRARLEAPTHTFRAANAPEFLRRGTWCPPSR
jgi:hypothetical protein